MIGKTRGQYNILENALYDSFQVIQVVIAFKNG